MAKVIGLSAQEIDQAFGQNLVQIFNEFPSPGQNWAKNMSLQKFQPSVNYLGKVYEALLKLEEFGFLALPARNGSIQGQSGCRFSLEAEFGFVIGRPLKIECFSTNPQATRWITRTLMSILLNLGVQEVFDTYYGPDLECFAIRDDSETFVEIHLSCI